MSKSHASLSQGSQESLFPCARAALGLRLQASHAALSCSRPEPETDATGSRGCEGVPRPGGPEPALLGAELAFSSAASRQAGQRLGVPTNHALAKLDVEVHEVAAILIR